MPDHRYPLMINGVPVVEAPEEIGSEVTHQKVVGGEGGGVGDEPVAAMNELAVPNRARAPATAGRSRPHRDVGVAPVAARQAGRCRGGELGDLPCGTDGVSD